MKYQQLIWVFLLLIFFLPVKAQHKAQLKFHKKLKNYAYEAFSNEEYNISLNLFLKLDSISLDSTQYDYMIGISALSSYNKYQALPYLLSSLQSKDTPLDVYYYLGRAYHLNHNFDTAITYYKKYLSLLLTQKHHHNLLEKFYHHHDRNLVHQTKSAKDVQRFISMCENGKKLKLTLVNAEIINLGPNINTKYSEYTPGLAPEEDVLFFNSKRPIHPKQLGWDDIDLKEDCYISFLDEDGWNYPQDIGSFLNIETDNSTLASISHDGDKLLFRNHALNWDGEVSGDLLISKKNSNQWTSPTPFPKPINSKYLEHSGSLASNERIFFFTSTRKGGFGGKDIYMVKKLPNDQWAIPQNLGPSINTAFDDDAPFISADGKTLFFSSKGHNSMGGYDIFKSELDDKAHIWSKAENMGFPINDTDDDIYFTLSSNGKNAYFTSIRKGGWGDKDIYKIILKQKSNSIEELIVLHGHIEDENSRIPIKAQITVTSLRGELIGIYDSNSLTGKFTMVLPAGKKYNVSVSSQNHLFHEEEISAPPTSGITEVDKNFELTPITSSRKSLLSHIHFAPGESEIKPESLPELNQLIYILKDYPASMVEIIGHTDSTSSPEFNKDLSFKRANAVVAYLVKNGIKKERLTAKGLGDKKPLFSNSSKDGRSRNRRTEFKIYNLHSFTPKDSNFIFSELSEPKEALIKERPQKGDFLPEKVHFPFKEFDKVTEYSQQKIENLIGLLNNFPELKIKIIAHSDIIGNAQYNLILSQKRAKTIYNYLISKGIQSNRLAIEAKGESEPLILSPSSKENVTNRRVEFLVVN